MANIKLNNKTETIYIAFYKAFGKRTTEFHRRAIAWWTNGVYSHVELILKKDGRWCQCTGSPTDGKVRCEPHIFDEETWDYVKLNITQEQLKILIEFYKEIDGKKYDWPGILGFVFKNRDNPDHWFCSESVTNALKIIGIPELRTVSPSHTSPNDLARIFGLLKKEKKSLLLTIPMLFKQEYKYE